MTDYRRNFIPGGSYFFMVAVAERSSRVLIDNIDLLRSAFHEVKRSMPFDLSAIVVMPEHLYCIWTLPAGDADYPTRWKKIKATFSHALPRGEHRSASRIVKGERGIWQRRCWEHTLRDDNDLCHHIDYLHFNPVKHSYVKQVVDWPYSTFHHYVRRGVYPIDWASSGLERVDGFGERSL